MADLPESAVYDAGVYQLEITDPVVGGVDGKSNAAARNLANRTKFLKAQTDSLSSNSATKVAVVNNSYAHALAGGTVNAITATYSPAITSLVDGMTVSVKLSGTNTNIAPTFSPNGLTAKIIIKNNGLEVKPYELAGITILKYDSVQDRWLCQNPDNYRRFNPVGAIIQMPTMDVPPGYLKANGALIQRSLYPELFNLLVTSQGFVQKTFTVSIGSPAIFTLTAHGFVGGERLRLTTTGALPTGLNTVTDYFVEYLSANTFYLSTGMPMSSPIVTTGTQSGVHTFTQSLYGLGDGSTTFNLPDLRGLFLRGIDDSAGIDTDRVIGTMQKGSIVAIDTNTGASTSLYQASTFQAETVKRIRESMGVDNFSTTSYPGVTVDLVLATTTQVALKGTGTDGTFTTGVSRPVNASVLFCVKY